MEAVGRLDALLAPLFARYEALGGNDVFSELERQVWERIAAGVPLDAIARDLDRHPQAVENTRQRIIAALRRAGAMPAPAPRR